MHENLNKTGTQFRIDSFGFHLQARRDPQCVCDAIRRAHAKHAAPMPRERSP
jgi:hypothetical protein